MSIPEIPRINGPDVSISDYRKFAPEHVQNPGDWGVFILLVADVDRNGSTSTHVIELFPSHESNIDILEVAQRLSKQLKCTNMRIFLAQLGTAAEIGALNTGVQFLNLDDGSEMETLPPRRGASLDVLVENEEIKQQLRSVTLDEIKPRLNVKP